MLDIAGELRTAGQHSAAGRWLQAEAAYKSVLRVAPERAEAWSGIGLIAYQTKNYVDAERFFRRALELQPRNPDRYDCLGIVFRALNRLDEAIAHYERALVLEPNRAATLSNLGNALALAGQARALTVLQQAVTLEPTSALFRSNFARALMKFDQPAEALEQFERVRMLAPGPAVEVDCGHALMRLERYDEAIAAYRRAEAAGSRDHEMLHNLATALQYLGRMDEAVEAYRAALAVKPDFAVSRRQLASARKYQAVDDDASELEKLLNEPKLSIEERAEVHIALAKILDDIGDYQRAFSHLQAGNQQIRATIDYSADKNSDYIDAVIETFDERFFADRLSFGLDTEVPLFILGMPRSGTTLVEQILASHPQVHGAGELKKINELFADLRKRLKPDVAMPRIARLMDKKTAEDVAQEYLEYLLSFNPRARYVCDKMPFNFRALGLISLLFPKARIIHCMRNPLDTGISCYFARFKEELAFSFNLMEIGRYYRDYKRLMDHWQTVVHNPVLEVQYERLVASQAEETRRILEFCRLPWDDACLRFHETERPVITASNWQVRQPMYASSAGRWHNYRRFLDPLIAALEIRPEELDREARGEVGAQLYQS